MITRKMNERITFFEITTTQDENGDFVETSKDLFSCWAEVPKATTKEFRDRSIENIEAIQKRRIRRVFYIRFRKDIDTVMHLNWREMKFKIIDMEEDWQSKNMLMITCEVVE